jgi:hypothetical protein
VLQIYERRGKKLIATWGVLEEDLIRRLPTMSLDYVIPILTTLLSVRPSHALWNNFKDRIVKTTDNGEDLTRDEIFEILRCYHEGGSRNQVWSWIQDKFLIGRGYYMYMDLNEL